MTSPARGTDTWFRRTLIWLVLAGVVGVMADLALARHWATPIQVLPWVPLAAVLVAALWVLLRPGGVATRVARWVAAASIGLGLFGMVRHVIANHDAGPLDAVYGPQWDSMGSAARWWHATIESFGPSPTLAPGAMVAIAVLLLVALAGGQRAVRVTVEDRQRSLVD